jgi:hypothetical protein
MQSSRIASDKYSVNSDPQFHSVRLDSCSDRSIQEFHGNKWICFGFEVNAVFCYILPCSPVEVHRRLGTTCCFCLFGWIVSQAKIKQETDGKQRLPLDPENGGIMLVLNVGNILRTTRQYIPEHSILYYFSASLFVKLNSTGLDWIRLRCQQPSNFTVTSHISGSGYCVHLQPYKLSQSVRLNFLRTYINLKGGERSRILNPVATFQTTAFKLSLAENYEVLEYCAGPTQACEF